MKTTRFATCWRGLALACGILTLAVSVEAKKPTKPPPDPSVDSGIVYAQIEGDLYAVNPDGSGQQYLLTPPDGVDLDHIRSSHTTHDGERWFVGWQAVGGFYPDGESARFCLVAMSESGAVFTLHDDVMLQPSAGSRSSLRWVPGDGAVSWLAMRWDGGAIVEWGVYTLDIEFMPDGLVAVGSPALVDWTAGLFELWYEEPGGPYVPGYYLLATEYDWSPDGDAIVYSACRSEDWDTQLHMADFSGAAMQLTYDVDTFPSTPRWSPDGTRIVFHLKQQHQLDVIDLVAEDRYTLFATRRTDYREMVAFPEWSPASTHVVYCYYTAGRQGSPMKTALRVIAADGSGNTTLTDSYGGVSPVGWCAEE